VSSEQGTKREFRIYRYDPTQGGEGRFDNYELHVTDETRTTILDVLIRLQKEQDPTLSSAMPAGSTCAAHAGW